MVHGNVSQSGSLRVTSRLEKQRPQSEVAHPYSTHIPFAQLFFLSKFLSLTTIALFYRLIQRRVITLATALWVTLAETVNLWLLYVQATLVSTVALVSWVQVAHYAFALLVTLTRTTTAANTPDAIRCLVKTVRTNWQTDLTAAPVEPARPRPIYSFSFSLSLFL